MFTGIIEKLGLVEECTTGPGGSVLWIGDSFSDLTPGESISVNGTCLTVTEIAPPDLARFALGKETVNRTSLVHFKKHQRVNLERSLKADARLSGHFVLGHVDTVGAIETKVESNESTVIEVSFDSEYLKYCADKGSIALDGISLTINRAFKELYFGKMELCLLPYTLKATNLGSAAKGQLVNLEFDILAKQLESLYVRSQPRA